jgi:hypothetical protein
VALNHAYTKFHFATVGSNAALELPHLRHVLLDAGPADGTVTALIAGAGPGARKEPNRLALFRCVSYTNEVDTRAAVCTLYPNGSLSG